MGLRVWFEGLGFRVYGLGLILPNNAESNGKENGT